MKQVHIRRSFFIDPDGQYHIVQVKIKETTSSMRLKQPLLLQSLYHNLILVIKSADVHLF